MNTIKSTFKPPIENFTFKRSVSQLFGVNKALYSRFNIPAGLHNGADFVWRDSEKKGYGQPILSATDGIISRVYIDCSPYYTRGNGIYVMTPDKKYETVYWHCSEIVAKPNQQVKQGDIIALAGNTGFVRPKPTQHGQGVYNGVHLHWAVKEIGKNNDYNSYIDPIPFLYTGEKLPIFFARDLYFGKNGDDVSWLQTVLKIELGDNVRYEPIAFFGRQTMESVRELQRKQNINPTFGYCGLKTRTYLNTKYSNFY